MHTHIKISADLARYNHINKKLIDMYHDASLRAGMSASMFDILYSIVEMGDGCRQKDICQACYIPKQTVHSSIRKMAEDGYLTLESGRGREKLIYLTEKGKIITEENILPIIEAENKVFLQMGEQQSLIFLNLLEEYMTRLDKTMKDLPSNRKEHV